MTRRLPAPTDKGPVMKPVLLLTRDDHVAALVAEQAAAVGVVLARVATAEAARSLWQRAAVVLVHDVDALARLPRRFGVIVICDSTQPPPERISPPPLLVTHLPDLAELPASLITFADGVIDPDHTLSLIRAMTGLALGDPAHPDAAAAAVALEHHALLDAWVSAGHPLPTAWQSVAVHGAPICSPPPGARVTG